MNDDTREKLLVEEGRGGKRNIMTAKVHFCREKKCTDEGLHKKRWNYGALFYFPHLEN